MPSDAELEPIASAQNGEIVEAILSRVDGRDEWRLVLELRAAPDAIVEIKAVLSGYDRNLTETWVYQWINA